MPSTNAHLFCFQLFASVFMVAPIKTLTKNCQLIAFGQTFSPAPWISLYKFFVCISVCVCPSVHNKNHYLFICPLEYLWHIMTIKVDRMGLLLLSEGSSSYFIGYLASLTLVTSTSSTTIIIITHLEVNIG